MKTFKTVIIDDERLAREEVKRALKIYPEFEIIGESSHVDEAKIIIEKMIINLIFFIQMMVVSHGRRSSMELMPVHLYLAWYRTMKMKIYSLLEQITASMFLLIRVPSGNIGMRDFLMFKYQI